MNVVPLKPISNLAEELEVLLNKVKRGEVDTVVCVFSTKEEYAFLTNKDKEKSLAFATLLQSYCVDRIKF